MDLVKDIVEIYPKFLNSHYSKVKKPPYILIVAA